MKRNKNTNIYRLSLIFITLIAFLSACETEVTPKPRAYFRIDIPEHQFIAFDSAFPYQFEYADNSILKNAQRPEHPYWLYIDYPHFNARIYLTYNRIENNLRQMLDDANEMAYKHISVASDIQQNLIILPEQKVYGMIYEIKGQKVASPLNFYLTDSVNHFMRGSLYFNMMPHNDSLKPVIEGIEKDMQHLIKSFIWNDDSLTLK